MSATEETKSEVAEVQEQATPDGEGVVLGCSVQNVEEESKKNPKGAMLIFTQGECGDCPPFVEEARKETNQMTILVAPTEDPSCNSLWEKYGLPKDGRTPQAIYFKNGEEKGRVDPIGKKWDQIRQELNAAGK